MFFIRLILFLTIAINVIVFNVENTNTYALKDKGMTEDTTSSEAFEIFYNRICSISLNESTLLSPKAWCKKDATPGSGGIVLQSPSQYCSNKRAPGIRQKELERLSTLGLGVPISTETDANHTSKHDVMTSQTKPDTSLVMKYDLNLTIEENDKILKSARK